MKSKSEIVSDISNSKYFSNETADCEFEIGNLNVLNLMEMRFSQFMYRIEILHFSYEVEGMEGFNVKKKVCSNDNWVWGSTFPFLFISFNRNRSKSETKTFI